MKKVLVIGSGPIVIGQACEFDYSGTLALKALRQAGFSPILINSNPATIMTDPALATKTYIEPLTETSILAIIKKERPEYLLPTLGGQTALNLATKLARNPEFAGLGCTIWAASPEAIHRAEDRLVFKNLLDGLGLPSAKSMLVSHEKQIAEAVEKIGAPAIIRPSFTLGGEGSGFAYSQKELVAKIERGLEVSPVHSVLVEQSLQGWKEFELEVVRDVANNFIVVCNIENLDPMGVHTGDSITIAPSMTLSDTDLQWMREASKKIMEAVGVQTGGSNVQFAQNPVTYEMVIIEMNPRVSRSSALASKATGFPIAKTATLLAAGQVLHKIPNDITGVTPASFEPMIDYVVSKIPRFDMEKFIPRSESAVEVERLGSSMKSVGEVMSIGRTFRESMQKALVSLEQAQTNFFNSREPDDLKQLRERLKIAHPRRIFSVLKALLKGFSIEEISEISGINAWFVHQMKAVTDLYKNKPGNLTNDFLLKAKQLGLPDREIGLWFKISERDVIAKRKTLGIHPRYSCVDTCAGEFEAKTPYFYSTYENVKEGQGIDRSLLSETHIQKQPAKSVMVVGSGPNRIGQGIEFDYACVHCSMSLKALGYDSIMVNCNPETVSTDFDVSSRLYFEPLTLEYIVEIYEREQPLGVVLQFGGQTPLKLAKDLQALGIPILGTSFDSIDIAEDRSRFHELVKKLDLKQPPGEMALSKEDARKIANDIGFPVLIRPSYVLGGRAMRIAYNQEEIESALEDPQFAENHDILIDHYLENAIEVDVDALSDGETAVIAGLMEHVEEAGIHSGDSTAVIPRITLPPHTEKVLRIQAKQLAVALKVKGLINVQFAIKENEIFVLEANPRSSRTVPFISKAIGKPLVEYATKLALGTKLKDLGLTQDLDLELDVFAVKRPVFPFDRFPGVDTLLGPEMRSTGEVMGRDIKFSTAFAKAIVAGGMLIPNGGRALITVRDVDKPAALTVGRMLLDLGFELEATEGTCKYLNKHNIKCILVAKGTEPAPTCIDHIVSGHYNFVLNTVQGETSVRQSFSIRRRCLEKKIPCITNMREMHALLEAMTGAKEKDWKVNALQDVIE